jgi:hypothetical protein
MTALLYMNRFWKPIILILMLSVSPDVFSQDISGSYRWFVDEGESSFEIYLSPINSKIGSTPISFQGEHCGVYFDGRRMDCSYEEYSIALNKVSENVFTGTILSAYSRTLSEIRVTYFPDTKKIRWQVTKDGEGQSYFPKDVIMEQ